MTHHTTITDCRELSFSRIIDAEPEYRDNGFRATIAKIDHDIHHVGGELQQAALEIMHPSSRQNTIAEQPRPTLLGSLLVACVGFSLGLKNMIGQRVNQITTFTSAFSVPFSFPVASATPIYPNNAMHSPWSASSKKSGNANFPFPPSYPPYSPREIRWINKHAVENACYERFPPFASQVGENIIYKLCGPNEGYQLAVMMNDKPIAVKTIPETTLDVVLAFDLRKPAKIREIELKNGTWLFAPHTDPVVSAELLTYYKTLKKKGLLSSDIPDSTALAPDKTGLRWFNNTPFIIIRDDNVILHKQDNNLFIELNNSVNRIHVPLIWENKKLRVSSPNRKKTIGTEGYLSYRFYPNMHPQNAQIYIDTVNRSMSIISSVKRKIKNMSIEQLRSIIRENLQINFNEAQLKKITRNIARLDVLLREMINTDNLYRNYSQYIGKNSAATINFYESPHRAAGELDPSVRLDTTTIAIYPAFYQEHDMLRMFRIFDIANRSQGGKSLFHFDTTFLEQNHPPRAYSQNSTLPINIETVIQQCSKQIIHHLAQLASNTTHPSMLIAGKDTRRDLEDKHPQFMQAQYWRYFKEQEMSKQDRHGEQTLQAYRDGLERWHMPLATATDLMRADRHFVKKSPLDSSFLTLVTLILYHHKPQPHT